MTTQENNVKHTAVNVAAFIDLTFGGKKKRKGKDADGNEIELAPFAAKAVKIDVASLPAAAHEFIFNYGLTQYLSDGSAGAKTQAEFDAGIDKKMDKLLSGDFSREAGERGSIYDSEDTLTRAKIKDWIKAQLKAQGVAGVKADVINQAVDGIYSDEAECKRFRDAAREEIAKQKALAAGGIDLARFGIKLPGAAA